MNPILTIAIPTYNRAKYLKKCLQSALSYCGDDIQIIVSDNNSSDETFEVVTSFMHDQRLIYHKNEQNIGPLDNFYLLIEKSKSEYVFFVTDDDYLLPGSVEVVLEFILQKKPDAFKTDLIILNEVSKSTSYYSYFDESIFPTSNDSMSLAKIWRSSHIYTGCCFRKESLIGNFNDLCFTHYPSMLLFGILNNNLAYLAYPTCMHIWENELFWDIDEQNKDLLLINSQIDILDFYAKSNLNSDFIFNCAFLVANNFLQENAYKIKLLPYRLWKYIAPKHKKILYQRMYYFKTINILNKLSKSLLKSVLNLKNLINES